MNVKQPVSNVKIFCHFKQLTEVNNNEQGHDDSKINQTEPVQIQSKCSGSTHERVECTCMEILKIEDTIISTYKNSASVCVCCICKTLKVDRLTFHPEVTTRKPRETKRFARFIKKTIITEKLALASMLYRMNLNLPTNYVSGLCIDYMGVYYLLNNVGT